MNTGPRRAAHPTRLWPDHRDPSRRRARHRPREGRHQPGLRRQREPRLSARRIPAASSLDALAAAADAAVRAALHTLNLPRRQRHSRRAQKARQKFPHATATKTTVTGKPQVTVFAHPASASPGQAGKPPGRRKRPASRGRGTVEPPAIPATTRGSRACAHTIRKQTLMHMRNTNTSTPQET